MNTAQLRIPLSDCPVPATEGLFDPAEGPARPHAVLLAHGAGADMRSDFLAAIAAGLSRRGLPVLRFDYPYMQLARDTGRRRPPDTKEVLERAHAAALAVLMEQCPGAKPLFVAKSMGCRIGVALAARGAPVAGLVHLGYPLHPQAKQHKLRTSGFDLVGVPSLFLQGNRDKLCDLGLLEEALGLFRAPVELDLVEGANHDFVLPKSWKRPAEEVRDELCERAVAWLERTL